MKINRREALGIGVAGSCLTLRPFEVCARTSGIPEVSSLRTCGLVNPLSLGDLPPRFSWKYGDPAARTAQTAYRVTVARSEEDLAAGRNLLWDSGRISSTQSVDIPYGGMPLPSRSRAFWQVEVWNGSFRGPLRSRPASWETGLAAANDWQAQWLASETEVARADRLAGLHWIAGTDNPKAGAHRHFRWSFDHPGGAAEFCISANETTGLWLNGTPLPPPQEYPQDGPVHWTQMAVYRIALKKGRNVFAVAVRRGIGFGIPPAVLAAVLRHGPSVNERLSSASPGWKISNEAPDGWERTEFDDRAWTDAAPATGTLPIGEPWPVYPANLLRKTFTLNGKVRTARLYATALGAYEAHINGAAVDDRKLAPEFTDPSKRVLYQAYDVTNALRDGDNALGFMIADGWYGSKFSLNGRFSFGHAPCRLKAQLEVEYVDGRRETIATGPGWQTSEAPIRAASIYDGEIYDARLEKADWALADGKTHGWRDAELIDPPSVPVEPQRCPPIRVCETRRPVSTRRLGAGRFLLDFGQNFAGWPRLAVTAGSGTVIEMRFAELLTVDGRADQSNLRAAWQRDIFIAAGRGQEVWVPRFTYHGFRYVEVSGVSDDLSAWSIEGLVGYQDLEQTGEFRVGDPVIRKFWENAVWSQKSNFFGLPTDCPQRDERLGWMGDAEVFWPAAAFNMDVGAFTARVMEDVRHGQSVKGGFPDCIPPYVPTVSLSSPGWADAGIILPWTSWQQYGDTGVIAANWSAMERYMDWILGANPNHLWVKGRGADYGDWLSVDAPVNDAGFATTPKDLIGTAFWAQDAIMMAKMAQAIGDAPAAARYNTLFAAVRSAFNTAYVKSDGMVGNGSQTGQVLAIRFGLLTPELTLDAGKHLKDDIERRGNHLSTGFLGTPHILDALALSGQTDVAITLLLQRTRPSWGYMVEQGATTMWERWDSNQISAGMNSRNHYAFGAIGSFLFRRIGGIAPAEPGFTKVEIAPIIDPRLGGGGATYHSICGTISTDWSTSGNRYRLDVGLPSGVTGTVALPGGRAVTARPGLNRFSGTIPPIAHGDPS